MNIGTADLIILKNQLRGSNLKTLIKEKKVTKWAIARDCNLTYRTILNWEQEKSMPSDDNAIVVGRYLGVIKPDEAEVLALKKEQTELKKKIDRLI